MNTPGNYEIINYINDVSLSNAEDSFKEEPLFYQYDGRGNTTELTDNRGVARDRYRYDPYGEPIPKASVGPNPWYTDNPYRYNGEDYDIDTGLQYLRARYYEPSTGRFLSRDSYLGDVSEPLSLNRYSYVTNNPVNYIDPSGHMPSSSGTAYQSQEEISDGLVYMKPVEQQERENAESESQQSLDLSNSDQYIDTTLSNNSSFIQEKIDQRPESQKKNCDDLTDADGGSNGYKPGVTQNKSNPVQANNDITEGDLRAGAKFLLKNPAVAAGVAVGVLSVALSNPVTVNGSEVGWKPPTQGAETDNTDNTYYFRGTTEGYEGNPSLQIIGITPASTDPLVSTIFATEAEGYGNGVLLIASSNDLEGVNIIEGNVLANLEKEVGIELTPIEFAQKASITISAKEARDILKDMGYHLPESIYSKEQLNSILKNTPRLTDEEIQIFVRKARK